MSSQRDELARLLQAGIDDMGLPIDAAQQAKLLQYIELIAKWNSVHNLTAVRDPKEMVTLHLLDSLSVLPHVQAKRWLDVGAGAGLPSIPLAICLPDTQFSAIDSVEKKASFMRQAKGVLGLPNFEVLSGRVEAQQPAHPYEAIISRAFSELGLFVRLTERLLSPTGRWFAMKGVMPEHELANPEFIHANVEVEHTYPLRVAGLEAERHLLVLKRKGI